MFYKSILLIFILYIIFIILNKINLGDNNINWGMIYTARSDGPLVL